MARRKVTPLTATQIKKAKHSEGNTRLSDGGGLYLLLQPSGKHWWRFDYSIKGKRKTLSFGTYPEISLLDARNQREAARELVAKRVDPSDERQAEKASYQNTFRHICDEWLEKQKPDWVERYTQTVESRLQRDILPDLGSLPIHEITPKQVLNVLQQIENRGAIETAHRCRVIVGQVFRYAMASDRCVHDPTIALKGALKKSKVKHHAAITDPQELGAFLRMAASYEGTLVVAAALQLMPRIAVRPGELAHCEWMEVNLETATWEIPEEKMKNNKPHIVPLSTQCVQIFEKVRPVSGTGRFVFPSIRSAKRPMSNMALSAALRCLGYETGDVTPHGFRATFRTLCDEVLRYRVDLIEHQLAHDVCDPLGRSYNRTSFLEERREMMQRWSDYLDELAQKPIPGFSGDIIMS